MRYVVLLTLALSFGCSPAVDAKPKPDEPVSVVRAEPEKPKKSISDILGLIEREESALKKTRESLKTFVTGLEILDGMNDESSLRAAIQVRKDCEELENRIEKHEAAIKGLEAELESLR